MAATRDRIPGHLRQYVVEQDYAAYDEIDQAVWRFVLLQTYARLCETAHPAYRDGLAQSGIDVERIPRIVEMDRRLAEFGWGAVAVDGFIPPRAFQEFQALGILTIAADIRRPEHLAYTPAPDIIHESAGHAPIIPEPGYRAYLRRFGEVGTRAFSSPGDRRVYRAIHALSRLKEISDAPAAEIQRVESELAEAEAELREPSEAARLSRLHWWTVEYGLVGTPDRYRIYGAGLLSSLGESHFCHRSEVRKLALDPSCIEVGYDITRPQPQLFVAQSFEVLCDVLEQVASGLAQCKGGALALERALASEELATVELDGGLQITGVLEARGETGGAPAWLRFRGPCALAERGRALPECGRDVLPDGFLAPIGVLADGGLPRGPDDSGRSGDVDLLFHSGVRVTGRAAREVRGPDGRVRALALEHCRVQRGGELLFAPDAGRFLLPIGERGTAAVSGPAAPGFFSDTEFPARRLPRSQGHRGDDPQRLDLYRRALRLWEKPEAPDLVSGFEEIEEALAEGFPDNWLLRWNLLESLCKVGRGAELARELRERLLEVEACFPDDAPVSTGLRFLDDRYPPPTD